MPEQNDDWKRQLAAEFSAQPAPKQQTAIGMRQAVAFGASQNPDEYARRLSIGRKFGLPPEVVEGNEKDLEIEGDLNRLDYARFVENTPRTAKWSSSIDNAAVSGVDEIQRLAEIEQHAGTIRALTPWESFEMRYIDPAKRKLLEFPLTRMGLEAVGATAGTAGNAAAFVGVNGSNPKKGNALQRVETFLSPKSVGLKENQLDTLVKNVAPMIPAALASGGTGLIARALGLSDKASKVLRGLSVGALFTADMGGKTYTDMKAAGADDYDARLAANRVAAINAPVQSLFGFQHFIPALERNPILTALGMGGAMGVSGQLGSNVVTDRPLTEGLATSAIHGAAIQSGMHLGMGFFNDFAKIVVSAEQSKLKARSPEKFHEALSEIFDGHENLRIPAEQFETYFQGKGMDPVQVAQELGVKNYLEAKAAGTDIEVAPADFLGKLDAEHQKGLLGDIVNPATGLSLSQQREGEAELQKWVAEGGPEKLAAETAKVDAETASSGEYIAVKEQLRQQYVDAGETPELADNYATLQANVYANLARETGLKPTELLDLYKPKMVIGEVPEASLAQASPAAPEQPRGWFNVRPDGTFEIGKTKFGDFSTFVHEPAHSYLFMLGDLSKREGASDILKADHQKILDFLGAKDGEQLTTEQHEQWARANEQYLREGKAPSQSLKAVFQRFAVWLSSIYKRASDLGVELSDDIRGVFDRLYAAEEGVNRAEKEAGPQLFTTPEEAGWTPEQFHAYAESKGLEVEQAKAEILSKLNEAAIRERSESWREEERNVREAVTVEVDAKPEYTAIRSLRGGKLEDGTELTLNRESLVKQFGEARAKELQAKHPGLYRNEGGVDAETAAEILGYNSGEEMLRALETAPKRSAAIDQATREYMTAKHGDIRYDGTLEDQARIALENDKKAANLHSEIKALQKKLDAAKKGAADAKAAMRGIEIPPIEAFRKTAQSMVEGKALIDLQPTRYLDASRKASREAFDALRKGDIEEAKNLKQRELINHFLFREASKAKAEAEQTLNYVRRYSAKAVRERIAKAGGEEGQHVYLDQIDNILESFRFVRESAVSIREQRQKFMDFATQKQAEAEAQFYALNPDWAKDHPDGELPEIPPVVDTSIAGMSKNYRELNISELRAVRDALKNIETLAKHAYGVMRDGKLVSFAQEVADFERIARENNKVKAVPRSGAKLTAPEKAADWLHSGDAYMQKIEWYIDRLDGSDVNGPARRNTKKLIDDAWGKKLEMSSEVYAKLKAAEEARPKEDLRDLYEPTGIAFPHSDRPLNRFQLISWALNLGTEENQKVALIGEGLIGADGNPSPLVDQALRTLRASELKFIQGVWDSLDSMLPAVREKALRTTGIEPKLKKVVPFDVTSADGEVVHMKGGYYPLKGEPGERVGRRQTDPANLTVVGYQKPKTSTSHLQQVTGATYKLQLDYKSVLERHLADVINDTTMGEAIAQTYKFISDDSVRTTMRETLGPREEAEFLKWLQDVASEGRGAAKDSNFLINFLMSRRSGMVAARLGGNLSSYLVQFGDVFKAIADPDVKSSYLLKAFVDVRTRPSAMIEEIRSLSPNEMRFRERNFNREIREMLADRSVFDQKRAVVTDFLMQGFQVMDRFITFPTWLARYRQGIAEHGDSGRATMEADRIIARTFQAGDPRNMSRMMREGGLMKLLTTFQGDANTWYGIISSSVRSGNMRAISVSLFALIAEQVVGQYIRNRGPKDDDNKAGWLLYQTLAAGLGKVPVFGDWAQYGIDSALGKYASLQNPTYQALEVTGKAAKSVVSDQKDAQEKAQDITEATGIWVGVPGISQAIRTWKYVHKVQQGKERPEGAMDALRGALQGSSKK